MKVEFKDITLKKKYDSLSETMQSMGSTIVAFSGGVDSTLVASVAQKTLGDKALIVTANSPSLAETEFDELLKIAEELNFNHRVIDTKEIEKVKYRENSPQRCYFCKEELYTELKKLAFEESIPWIINGTNIDDLGDFRPGIKAAKDFMVRSPLVESGINKKEVRALAKEMNISNWDKPAQACLSSRVAYGIKITDVILNQISVAENHIKILGIDQVRVRHHGNLARIEVPKKQISILLDEDNNRKITEKLKELGYSYVTVDLQGFRSGSMNDQLANSTFR
ncbi:MAG: ATP-dependent sacrificial sulfur transferase LarE [SAR202 cluster bacterium]|nr:TIGR00268 family protein [Chloroflexota bacterium]MQG39788.1 ATP-dependent sacrificial sulfur transferase LarE [SAR202 cluster bacterium]|tara:strand:- start:111 stop:953 length:843 start_codon:yes stop_codon:yes gene_type:complete